MENAEIIELFANKLSDIILFQRAVKKTAQKELKYIEEYAAQFQDKPDIVELSSSHDVMYFSDAVNGTATPYAHRVSSIEDRYLSIVLHKNKQYHWLLAEAYEEFADFLERAYAFMGYRDSNFWPMSDFGKISISDLPTKDFNWHLEHARTKRDLPHSILNRFRKQFPEIVDIETNNALNINLALAVTLIEFLRHIIVHNGGKVSDKSKFIERILKKAGLYNNGRYEDSYVQFIESFFGTGEYENTIALLEIKVDMNVPLDVTIDQFGKLTGYLMAYALELYKNIESKIS